jgi:3-methyl-2-oxobutanoate hydroxymethyltransferase
MPTYSDYRGHKVANGQRPVSMITCYDFPTARLVDQAGVDVVFVGDSVGTNVLGYESPNQVTMDDMLHHLRAVRRGVERASLLVDMPYGSYDAIPYALDNARQFIEAGAEAVKLEGAFPDTVAALVAAGIPVCGHIGFTPQWMTKAEVHGKHIEEAVELVRTAEELDQAGISSLVLELIPAELAGLITGRIKAATIGIGAGAACDGQVQVIQDVLGITERTMRHAMRNIDLGTAIRDAVIRYHLAVHEGAFPGPEHARHLEPVIIDQVVGLLSK